MIKKLLLAAAATVALSGTALAATDGTLGHTSTGSFHIGVRLPLLVDITGMKDIHHTFTAAEISAAASVASYTPVVLPQHNFCIYSNNGTHGAYALKISGPAGVGNEVFSLNGPGATSIPMRINVSDNVNNIFADGALTNFQVFPNGTKVTGYLADNSGNGRPNTLDCSDVGDNAAIQVQFPVGGLLAAEAGHYHGHITITVSPT